MIKDFPEGVAGFEYGGAADFDMSWSQECRDQVCLCVHGEGERRRGAGRQEDLAPAWGDW